MREDGHPLATYEIHYQLRMARQLTIQRGDITRLSVDAIVNAANERLLGGAGVDGAIHRAAGPALKEACRGIPEVEPGVRCPTGEARITPGFSLPAKFVVHTVGPIWRGGFASEPALLESCYRNSLALAKEAGLETVAFPCISTGIYAYPLADACGIAVRVCREHLAGETSLREIILVAFADEDAHALEEARGETSDPANG